VLIKAKACREAAALLSISPEAHHRSKVEIKTTAGGAKLPKCHICAHRHNKTRLLL